MPCAPSRSTRRPSLSARSTRSDVSSTYGPQARGVGLHPLGQLLDLERRDAVDALEHDVLLGERGLELLTEDLRVEDVLHADADARGLVGVGGPDAAARRADLEAPEVALARRVDGDVPGHDQVRVPGDPHGLGRDPAALELVQLGHEQAGVDHATGADDAELAGEDPGRNVMERERLAVADDRVTGVRPALVAADDVRVQGEEVDDLPLALVTPLGAHDHGGRHLSESLVAPSVRAAVHMGCGRSEPKSARGAAIPSTGLWAELGYSVRR